ncbi:MAG: 30S ribosomal protein S7 [Patescibacteria group bacterium]|nr:30S ribosomal protein S7 [Patescibacteria group bacterium]
MSRTGRSIRKKILKPDGHYHSVIVSRFINKVLKNGKKSAAQEIIYGCLELISENKKESLEVLKKALEQVTPKMEVRARRIGGATYQVPGPVRHDRAESLAIRWLLAGAKTHKGMPMSKRLAEELKEAALGQGFAVKKRETMHKMAEANRAFAHFRW